MPESAVGRELAKAINARFDRDPMPVGDFLFADEVAILEAVPNGWAKIDGRWVQIELVVDQWGRTDAEGKPIPGVLRQATRLPGGGGKVTELQLPLRSPERAG